jgi:hypothetical protein
MAAKHAAGNEHPCEAHQVSACRTQPAAPREIPRALSRLAARGLDHREAVVTEPNHGGNSTAFRSGNHEISIAHPQWLKEDALKVAVHTVRGRVPAPTRRSEALPMKRSAC